MGFKMCYDSLIEKIWNANGPSSEIDREFKKVVGMVSRHDLTCPENFGYILLMIHSMVDEGWYISLTGPDAGTYDVTMFYNKVAVYKATGEYSHSNPCYAAMIAIINAKDRDESIKVKLYRMPDEDKTYDHIAKTSRELLTKEILMDTNNEDILTKLVMEKLPYPEEEIRTVVDHVLTTELGY